MYNYVKPISLISTLAVLAACGGGSTGGGVGGVGGGPVITPTPIEPTLSATQISADRADINSIRGRRDSPLLSILPAGTATYNGHAAFAVNIDGYDDPNGMIGDMSLTAQLRGTGDSVSGTINNLHTHRNNNPIEKLTGSIAVNGSLSDETKDMDGLLSGSIGGFFGGTEATQVDISGSIDGTMEDTRLADTVIPVPLLPDIRIPNYDDFTGMSGTHRGTFSGGQTGAFSGSWGVD